MQTTITGIVYLDMLQQFLIPLLYELDQEGRIHFQQNEASPHYLGEVSECLSIRFPGRPSCSPYLTPMNNFLWGFVKDRVFIPHLPANAVGLRTRSTAAVAEVMPEMLHGVWQETDYR
jgi:hypothetical protein